METMAAVTDGRQGRRHDSRLRRVPIIWVLLVFNVLTPGQSFLLPIPHRIAQLLTQGTLYVALVLALSINPRMRMRPNWFLGLYTVLAIDSLMMSVRLVGLGTEYRSLRLVVFLFVLWLLTPWWGRRDLIILRTHVRLISALLGLVIAGTLHRTRQSHAGWPSDWCDLANRRDRGCALRGRGRWPDGAAVALPSRIWPPCRHHHNVHHDLPRAEPHTYGPDSHAHRTARWRWVPVARKATGSQDFRDSAPRSCCDRSSGCTVAGEMGSSWREFSGNRKSHRSHKSVVCGARGPPADHQRHFRRWAHERLGNRIVGSDSERAVH